MANIIRFDPFSVARFDPFGESFEDAFRRMLRPVRWEGAEGAPVDIKVDVEENDKAYVVKAEVPGVKKEDIDVRIDGNVVTISAESKREKEVKEKGKVIRSERYYGSMLRSFSLGNDVNDAEATAKYTDGILELTLPKKETTAAKKLAVK